MPDEITDEYLEVCPTDVLEARRILKSVDYGDQIRGVRMLEESTASNHPDAQYLLGLAAELGLGTPVDLEKAKKHYRNAMSVPNANVQSILALKFALRHLLGTLKELEVEWYERAVQLGSTDALWGLAHRLHRGEGCERDHDRAMRLYTAAAAAGDPYSAETLGEEYLYRDDPDVALAAKYFEAAAEQGLVKSQCQIGLMYWYGEGVPCCPVTALSWYRKAAAQGSREAYIKIGVLLCEPQYSFCSPTEAFELFGKALDSPSEETVRLARFNLGLCYLNGEGVGLDKNQAAREFLCAFKVGCIYSCRYLARLSSEGVFPPDDGRTADDWKKLAKEHEGEIAKWESKKSLYE